MLVPAEIQNGVLS